jgi:hypothetical protein
VIGSGGSSEVQEGNLGGKVVAVKTLKDGSKLGVCITSNPFFGVY